VIASQAVAPHAHAASQLGSLKALGTVALAMQIGHRKMVVPPIVPSQQLWTMAVATVYARLAPPQPLVLVLLATISSHL